MTLTDIFITARELLLDGLWGISTDSVLNGIPETQSPTSPSDVSAELKRAMNGFKTLAMDESGSQVNYGLLIDSLEYQEYRQNCTPQLRSLNLDELAGRDEKLAFWINVYNALVIDQVIASGVRQSVTEGTLGIIKFFRQGAYNIGGYRFSLEDIEHGILRGNRGNPSIPGAHFASTDPRRAYMIDLLDARIHFTLNCASQSCPPIGIYAPERIQTQLDLAARNFINQEVRFNSAKDKLQTTMIHKWYASDFGGTSGVLDFLIKHLPDDERRAWLTEKGGKAELEYSPYDWALNG